MTPAGRPGRGRRGLALLTLIVTAAAVSAGLLRHTTVDRADFAFCNQSEPGSLDPALETGLAGGRLIEALFEGLTRLDPATNAPLPGLASSWSVSDDGLTWRFTLRPEARWSHGEPVTAHDVRDSWLRLLDPSTGARYAYLLWAVEGARDYSTTPPGTTPDPTPLGLEAPDDHTLVVTLERPFPAFAQLTAWFSLAPVHLPTVRRHGPSWTRPEHIVGNGPFRLVERRLSDRIRLAASPTYWGADEVALETVDAYAASGVTTQLNMYLTGMVDWMIKPPPGLHDLLLQRDDVVTGPQLGVSFLRFNVRRPPFDDPLVRRALTLSLDRQALTRDVLRGGQRPARAFVPAGLPGYAPPEVELHDPARARELLALTGLPEGTAFELLYPHNEIVRDVCQAVAETWRAELGLDVSLVNQEFGVYLDSTVRGRYDVSWGVWIGDFSDPATFLDIFQSASENNRTGWTDPAYDEAVSAAARAPRPAERMARYREAEALLLDALPVAPLYQRINMNMVAPRVSGFADNPLDRHPLRDLAVTSEAPR